nr:MAG TPA: hypothetical protein [Caudoviricetes sp.]
MRLPRMAASLLLCSSPSRRIAAVKGSLFSSSARNAAFSSGVDFESRAA